jgi:hypothetical protein
MARGDLNAANQGRNERGNAISDRDIETAVLRVLTTKLGLSERGVQAIQTLAGLRNAAGVPDKPGAAVRRGDLDALARVASMKTQPLTGAPSAADYNALRKEVAMLYEALGLIAQAVNGDF